MMIRRVMYTKSSTLAIWHSCHRLAVLVHRRATSSVSAAARTVTRGVLLMTTPISNIRTIPEFDDLLHFVSDIYFDADTYCTVVYFDYRIHSWSWLMYSCLFSCLCAVVKVILWTGGAQEGWQSTPTIGVRVIQSMFCKFDTKRDIWALQNTSGGGITQIFKL